LIGGALMLFSFLVVPAIIVQGYLVRVLRSAARGDDEAPSFTEWGELLVDGVKLLVITIAYTLPIYALMAGLIFAVPMGSGAGGSRLGALLVGFVILLLALVVSYLIPATAANFAIEGSLVAAFDFGTVLGGAFSKSYAVGVVLAIVVGLTLGLVAGALSIVLVGIPLLFYVQVVTYYLFGRGFADGRGESLDDVGSAPAETAPPA
jgi:hypothetical protein